MTLQALASLPEPHVLDLFLPNIGANKGTILWPESYQSYQFVLNLVTMITKYIKTQNTFNNLIVLSPNPALGPIKSLNLGRNPASISGPVEFTSS